jgi:predicted small lipoprotein YifL
MTQRSAVRVLLAAAALAALAACGGGPTEPSPPPSPQKSTPGATVTATGEGALVLHPSLDARYTFALETPIRIRETAGGAADWNFARISFFLGGKEIERGELGSDVIQRAGYSRIAANSNQLYNVIFRSNSDNFDRVDITLGFGDIKDARQFTLAVPFSSFSDVNLSLTPLSVPSDGTVRLGR